MALHHEMASRFSLQGPQQIQLLVEPFGLETNSGFGDDAFLKDELAIGHALLIAKLPEGMQKEARSQAYANA